MSIYQKKLYYDKGLTKDQIANRTLAMTDLRAFVAMVAPHRVLGHCQLDMLKFFMDESSHQLLLYPRGHQKSACIAYLAAWEIINNPAITILYASATSSLAIAQTGIIKQTLESPIASKYWPELLETEEGKRSMWRQDAFCVDHKKRYEEGIRDYTLMACGIGANITGFHADLIILDDIVVSDNVETKSERDKLKNWYSYLASILNPGGRVKVIGTRYHPMDLYHDLISMEEELYDESGHVTGHQRVYKFDQKVVEIDGEFLWPRQKRSDGKWFGFDRQILSKKKAEYINKANFFAQYYNNPTDPLNKRISDFNYYNKEDLSNSGNIWYHKGKRLNVFAAIDFAATISKKADYTAIVVIGIDSDHNVFILDIARFKTEKISVMVSELTRLFNKWRFIKLRAEASAQQNLVVEQIKETNRNNGIFYSVDKTTPKQDKEIRIMTNLEPRYADGKIFHYKGGNCEELEQELVSTRPPHDDISDALASVIEIAIAPTKRLHSVSTNNIVYHPAFGGVV